MAVAGAGGAWPCNCCCNSRSSTSCSSTSLATRFLEALLALFFLWPMVAPWTVRSLARRGGWTRGGRSDGAVVGAGVGVVGVVAGRAGGAGAGAVGSFPSGMGGMGVLRLVRRRWTRGAALSTLGSVGLEAVLCVGCSLGGTGGATLGSGAGATLGSGAGCTLGGAAPATLGGGALLTMEVSRWRAAMWRNFCSAEAGTIAPMVVRRSCAARSVLSASEIVGTWQWAG